MMMAGVWPPSRSGECACWLQRVPLLPQSDSSGPPDHWPSAGDSCLLGSQDGDVEGRSLSSTPFFLLETVITGDLLASKGGEAGERSWLQRPAYNSSVCPVFSRGFSLRDLNMGKGLGSWLPPGQSQKDGAEREKAGVPFLRALAQRLDRVQGGAGPAWSLLPSGPSDSPKPQNPCRLACPPSGPVGSSIRQPEPSPTHPVSFPSSWPGVFRYLDLIQWGLSSCSLPWTKLPVSSTNPLLA